MKYKFGGNGILHLNTLLANSMENVIVRIQTLKDLKLALQMELSGV